MFVWCEFLAILTSIEVKILFLYNFDSEVNLLLVLLEAASIIACLQYERYFRLRKVWFRTIGSVQNRFELKYNQDSYK